ncbi:STAS domain-containing protein [Streptomyces sp. NPDC055055]
MGQELSACDILHAFGGTLYSSFGAHVYRRKTRADGTALLQATGEFDADSSGCLRQALSDARDTGADCVQLDLSAVTFGDSVFVHVLAHASTDSARLVLAGPLPGPLNRLFDLTGTTRVFHFDT